MSGLRFIHENVLRRVRRVSAYLDLYDDLHVGVWDAVITKVEWTVKSSTGTLVLAIHNGLEE